MNYKKLFFPIGGGKGLEHRLYGALLIAKKFNTKIEILKSGLLADTSYKNYAISKEFTHEVDDLIKANHDLETQDFIELFNKVVKDLEVDESLINLKILEGLRSSIIEQESKYCDLVIAAAPEAGVATATFETAVLKSGKSVLMFPRTMKKFSMDSVIIGWNNSPEASRAVTSSIEILKQAQKVHIISSKEYTKDEEKKQQLLDYLKEHDINASFEIVKTTRVPGQALLDSALDGNFDLIIAGAYGHKGLKELMFGGTTRYLLEHSNIPVFMSH